MPCGGEPQYYCDNCGASGDYDSHDDVNTSCQEYDPIFDYDWEDDNYYDES